METLSPSSVLQCTCITGSVRCVAYVSGLFWNGGRSVNWFLLILILICTAELFVKDSQCICMIASIFMYTLVSLFQNSCCDQIIPTGSTALKNWANQSQSHSFLILKKKKKKHLILLSVLMIYEICIHLRYLCICSETLF